MQQQDDTTQETRTAVTKKDRPGRQRRATAGYAPGTAIGRYVVERKLGHGGMGVVYQARDPELGRSVAIKLLSIEAEGKVESRRLHRERLLREAQALAQLSHPNVVTVYDAGTVGDRVFVAMQLLEGDSLRAWLDAEDRHWREVLEVFLAAGAGLAAAHRSGIIHRDFKPANVVVATDGRVRVIDFGLARAARDDAPDSTALTDTSSEGSDDDDASSHASTSPAAATDRSNALETPLTVAGTIMGTPGYMAPEQHLGRELDAHCDQFSFCVALWEGLFGERPFAGRRRQLLKQSVLAGRIRQPRGGHKVPRRIRHVLERGLSVDPADRYRDMHELLAALRRDRWRSVMRWAPLAAAAVVAAMALAFAGSRAEPDEPCQGGKEKLAEVWNADRRSAIGAAFTATGKQFAADASRAVIRILDDRAEQWSAMHVEACRATRVRGEQSEALLDRRMACLSERLAELDAQVGVFEQADPDAVQRGVNAALSLTSLDGCADARSLLARVKEPTDPDVLQKSGQVRADALRARALLQIGRMEEAARLAEETATRAAPLENPSVTALAFVIRGTARHKTGKVKEAAESFRAGMRAAEAAGDDRLAVDAGIGFIYALADGLERYADALAFASDVEAKLERIGRPAHPRARLQRVLGAIKVRRGRYDEAITDLVMARELLEQGGDVAGSEIYQVLNYLAMAYWYRADLELAAETYDQGLLLARELYGDNHPNTAVVYANKGHVLSDRGDVDQALEHYERALTSFEAAYGPEHQNVARMINNVADAHRQLGNGERALALYQRGLEIWKTHSEPSKNDMATLHHNLGWQHLALGKPERAAASFDQALALRAEVLGRNHPFYAEDLVGAGAVSLARGDTRGAVDRFEQALAVCKRAPGESCSAESAAHLGIGRVRLARGVPGRAIAPLQRAMTLRADKEVDPVELAEAQLALARALWDSGKDKLEARALATRAAAAYQKAGRRAVKGRDEARAFLEQHRQ